MKCDNLSAHFVLQNNNLNITALCFHVDITKNELFTVHASPSFWMFLFEKQADKKIQTIKTVNVEGYGATTCVRMAYKAYDMGFDFSFRKVDPTVDTITNSQKKKFDKLKSWEDSPFHEYQCNKCGTCFAIVKEHQKTKCADADCTSGSNKNCTHKMCKQCCVKHCLLLACKVKDHKAGPANNPTATTEVNGTTAMGVITCIKVKGMFDMYICPTSTGCVVLASDWSNK